MAYLEELLPEFRKGAKIRCNDWEKDLYIYMKNNLVYSSDMSKHLDYDILSDKWEPYQEPIDYEVACDTVNKLLDDKQKIKAENERLKELLKECVPYVTFKVNIEKNIGCTPPGAYLLTCIKDALGESEGK